MTSPQSPGLRPDEQAAGWTAGLPDTMPGHWDTPEGREMAMRCLSEPRSRPDISDFALANRVFLADRSDFDLIVWQTAAKERIRWLSAQLAAALASAVSHE